MTSTPTTQNPNTLIEEAIACLSAGKCMEAEKLYRQLLVLCSPDDFALEKCWGNLALALAAQGRKEEAIQALEKSLKINPRYGVALRNLDAIRQATPEKLRNQIGCPMASVLEPGDFFSAHSAWKKLITCEEASHIPALYDADAFLRWCQATGPYNATIKKGFTMFNRHKQEDILPLQICKELNAILMHPDDLSFTLKEPTGKFTAIEHNREAQFPIVCRLRHVLSTMKLLDLQGRIVSADPIVDKFFEKDPVFRYTSLLWTYLCMQNWQDLELGSVGKKGETSPASFIQEHIHTYIDHLLQESDPVSWMNIAFSDFFETENKETEIILMMAKCVFLWKPLVWFGLLEGRMGESYFGTTDLVAVRPTTLGMRLLPTLLASSMPGRVKATMPAHIGRNDPCCCGAKKPDGTPLKFKRCCGQMM